MKKIRYYRYIGRNGTVTTQVLLDNVIKIDLYNLIADEGKILTDGESKAHSVYVHIDDVDKWTEIDDKGQN